MLAEKNSKFQEEDYSETKIGEIVRVRLFMFCIASMGGLYLSIYNHSFSFVVFALNILSIFVLNTTELYCEMFFLFPYTMIYKHSAGSTSLFTYLTLVYMVVFLFKNSFRLNKHFAKWFVISAIYMLIGVGNNITGLIKLLSMAVIVSLFTSLINRKNFSDIVMYTCLGTVTSSLIGLRKASWPALASFFTNLKSEYINGVETYRFTGLYMDPNYFSILVIICLVSLLTLTFKKEIKGWIALILSIALVYFGCLTYSRVFYLTLLVAFIFVLILRIKSTGKIVGNFFLFVIFLSVGMYFASRAGIIDNILYRFSATDITNNRTNIWGQYLSYFNSSIKTLILGDGIGTAYYNGVGPHNTYIEMIYFLGIIGSSIYIAMYGCILKMGRLVEKRRLINYSLLIILMIMSATLGMLFSNDFGFLMIIVWMFMNIEIRSYNVVDIPTNEIESDGLKKRNGLMAE